MVFARAAYLILVFELFFLLSTKNLFAQLDTIPESNQKAFSIRSKILNEPRSIWIHLPTDYASSDEDFPVIYLLDGEGHFKYVSEMMEYLSAHDRNRIPPIIVVGIVNVDRRRDLTPVYPNRVDNGSDTSRLTAEGAGKFLSFIQHELVPYIDNNYRTQPHRILAGHSLGGRFAFYVKQEVPDLFQSTILISPAIKGLNDPLLTGFPQFLGNHPKLAGKMFLTMGNENTAYTELVDVLRQQLQELAPKSLDWSYIKYQDENHFSVTYKSMFDALKFFYRNWFIDFYARSEMSYKEIQLHFNALSREFGYIIKPPEDFVNSCGYQQLRIGNIEEAIEIFNENIKNYPNSFNVYDSMGEAYMIKGEEGLAIKNYEKSISLNPGNENGKAMLKRLKEIN